MQTVKDVITIHQCLHGYADGHQLIQTSTKIPSNADRVLLTLSDMSGPTMITGFQPYLTGYPLMDTGWYALAKTWYASEMPRPGCVWTHTLLIETADLARIQDPNSLLPLFLRPPKDRKSKEYTLPITLDLKGEDYDEQIYDDTPREVILMVLEGLYQQLDKPVYLTAPSANCYEDLVLRIWNQQYPKLRRGFLFCTGSLGNRKMYGKPFDLQIIPNASIRQIQREVTNGVFIEQGRTMDLVDPPSWLTTAANDLMKPLDSKLRQFMLLFGADAPEGRGTFSQILDVYTQVFEARPNPPQLSKVITLINKYYPEVQQGSRLKQILLGGSANGPKFSPKFSEIDLLRELAITGHYSAFDAETLKVRQRGREVVRHNPAQFKDLIFDLLSHEVNPLGEELIAGMSDAVTANIALELATEHQSVLFVITKYNPSIVIEPQIWRESSDRQRELYDFVRPQLESGKLSITDVIQAMLGVGSDVLAEDVIHQHGLTAVSAVLDFVESSPSSGLSENWEGAMKGKPKDVLKWLASPHQRRTETMALLTKLLDPHSEDVLKLGTRMWLPLARQYANEQGGQTRSSVMAFLLALGFNNPDVQAPELVAEAFQSVHDAASNETLPYASWRLLMYQAPSLTWWGEWDKCERLRRALVEKFKRFKWNLGFFLDSIKREDTFKEVLRNCSSEKKFFRLIAREIEQGSISASEAQRRALFHSN